MKGWILSEIRKLSEEIAEENSTLNLSQKDDKVMEIAKSVSLILKLSNVSRVEGLLALEDEVEKLSQPSYRLLKTIIINVIDGSDPERVEDAGLLMYCSGNYNGYEGLQNMIYILGMLDVQAGENPRSLECRIKAVIPTSILELYETAMEKLQTELKEIKPDISPVEELCKSEFPIVFGEEAYFPAKILDCVLREMDDRSVQRLLRDIDNSDAAVAMKGISGMARKRIFDNLSSRLSIMIAEDMKFMYSVRISDVTNSANKILQITAKLCEVGEINVKDNEFFSKFAKLLGITSGDFARPAVKEQRSELYGLVYEYCNRNDRRLQ